MRVTVYCYAGGHMTTLPPDATSGTCEVCGRRLNLVQCSRCHAPLPWRVPQRRANCGAALGLRARAVLVRAAEWSFLMGLWGITRGSGDLKIFYGMTVLSGWNLPFPEGTTVTVAISATEIRVTPINPRGPVATYKISDLLDVQIGGPGARVRQSWQVWSRADGSPFSIARAVFAQGVIQKLTTRVVVDTEVSFLFAGAGIRLHTRKSGTEGMRTQLDPLISQVVARRITGTLPPGRS
jgi:hypothetical protein